MGRDPQHHCLHPGQAQKADIATATDALCALSSSLAAWKPEAALTPTAIAADLFYAPAERSNAVKASAAESLQAYLSTERTSKARTLLAGTSSGR